MKLKCKSLLIVITGTLALTSMLTACAPDISANNYSLSSVGQAASTGRGTIIAATPVHVAGSSGVGTVAGAVAGGVAGSVIGGGARANILGGVGGAVLGGVVGNYAEKKLTEQTGMQYTVRLRNGSVVTVAQGMNPPLAVGQRVFVIFGNPARVVADMS